MDLPVAIRVLRLRLKCDPLYSDSVLATRRCATGTIVVWSRLCGWLAVSVTRFSLLRLAIGRLP
jgi:hypothetical protein